MFSEDAHYACWPSGRKKGREEMLYFYDKPLQRRWQNLEDECKGRLTGQQIVPGNPGTILKDVDTMLEFVGPKGVVSKSRNGSLPSECLSDLNARTGHPIELALNRPLLRDYPNLAGIFVLLRVMRLVRMQGTRLVVCPAALEMWRGLNPTERYFALLEALLFEAQSAVLGGEAKRRQPEQAYQGVLGFLSELTTRWHDYQDRAFFHVHSSWNEVLPWHLFLLQQLGLIELRRKTEQERQPWEGRGWLVGGAKLTPWGAAVTWGLLEFMNAQAEEARNAGSRGQQPGQPELALSEAEAPSAPNSGHTSETVGGFEPQRDEAESGQEEEECESETWFGVLQPPFQPYFPEWERIYEPPMDEARTGVHVFKISIGGWRGNSQVWRRLAVPADTFLDELAGAILDAFKFDRDHLYDFRYRDQQGRTRWYNHPESSEGPFTTEMTVGGSGLAIKDAMVFTFDYGDNWQFKVRLEKVEERPHSVKRSKVIASAGKAPEQYPNADSDW